jgi:hypothetical protein
LVSRPLHPASAPSRRRAPSTRSWSHISSDTRISSRPVPRGGFADPDDHLMQGGDYRLRSRDVACISRKSRRRSCTTRTKRARRRNPAGPAGGVVRARPGPVVASSLAATPPRPNRRVGPTGGVLAETRPPPAARRHSSTTRT